MEITSIQKNIPLATRKVQLVAAMVRKMRPEEALLALRFTTKAAAKPLQKAIMTALANAKQKGIDQKTLTFAALEVNEGAFLKRARSGSRGFVNPFKRRTSHIKIVLSDQLKIKNAKLKVKKDKEAIQ